MGNRFELTVVDENEDRGEQYIDIAIAEIQRIENLLTTFNEHSETSAINRHAGIEPVAVSEETFSLIKRSIQISDLTQGAFDITYGSAAKRYWHFDTSMTQLPDRKTLLQSVRLINYKNIILDHQNRTVFLKEKGMRIGFGGIGKGYAAERAKELLKSIGANAGVINASGDLTAWGTQPDGKPWTIGIADPANSNMPFSYLEVTDMAVATSGNYEKYALINGRKYGHTIDPKSGMPVQGIKSVTIICRNAEIADALATPVTVMGVRVGMDMINQMKGISCIIIDDDNRVYTSNDINLLK
jgi:thiamine biosynthesis lipoprotein